MLYTYYGDDFTGSTDVLETLAESGLPAVLFLTPPTPEDLAQFPHAQALGIAGDSRSRSPEWMTANLPAIFSTLASFGAPVVHYKTCSTFDSAAHTGSIGRAIELGIQAFSPRFVPIVAGKPRLGRFILFGNLFASAGEAVYRIDRHPGMSRHPVTPMREADLRRHLGCQTELPIALIDFRSLTAEALDEALADAPARQPAAVLFDTPDIPSLHRIGTLLWSHAVERPLFAAGSSGLTEAFIAAWRADGLLPATPVAIEAAPVDQLLVLSGSCSPITQAQIEWALARGFHGIPIDPARLLRDPAAFLAKALRLLATGQSLILYTALGPLDHGAPPPGAQLGTGLGQLLGRLIEHAGISRTLLCGGDTASHAMQQLPIRALTWAAPLTPGAPLCRAHSPDPLFHGAEFILKGGQIGPVNFFAAAESGSSRPSK